MSLVIPGAKCHAWQDWEPWGRDHKLPLPVPPTPTPESGLPARAGTKARLDPDPEARRGYLRIMEF